MVKRHFPLGLSTSHTGAEYVLLHSNDAFVEQIINNFLIRAI